MTRYYKSKRKKPRYLREALRNLDRGNLVEFIEWGKDELAHQMRRLNPATLHIAINELQEQIAKYTLENGYGDKVYDSGRQIGRLLSHAGSLLLAEAQLADIHQRLQDQLGIQNPTVTMNAQGRAVASIGGGCKLTWNDGQWMVTEFDTELWITSAEGLNIAASMSGVRLSGPLALTLAPARMLV